MPAIQSQVAEEVHPDVALVARAKQGDTAAFEQLVRQYERQIFRVAQHITQNREDAEDITQDAFFKAYEKLDQFQGNSKFSTWLVRIAVNESLMRLRKRKTSRTVSMDEDVQTEDGCHTARLRGVETEPGADCMGRANSARSCARRSRGCLPVSHGVYAARCGEPVDRRDGGGTRLERTGGEIEAAARAAAVARAVEPLLPADQRGGEAVTCTEFLSKLDDYFDGKVDVDFLAEVQGAREEVQPLRGGDGHDAQDHLDLSRERGI